MSVAMVYVFSIRSSVPCIRRSPTRPFSGFRVMLTVGASNKLLPLAFASRARMPAAALIKSASKVAPIAVPQGRQLAGLGKK